MPGDGMSAVQNPLFDTMMTEKELLQKHTELLDAYEAKLELLGEPILITKNIELTTNWKDTGIEGADLDTGTYIVQVYIYDPDHFHIYYAYWSGVMSWYNLEVNSSDTCEIVLHCAGHAINDETISLRTLNSSKTTGHKLRLQIKNAHSAKQAGASEVRFQFRKIL